MEFQSPEQATEPSAEQSPEQLIVAMTNEELQELLSELGLEATESQAISVKNLVKQFGSLDVAMEFIGSFEREARRAA